MCFLFLEKQKNSVSSPEIHYLRNYNISRLKSFAPFAYDYTIMKYVRKQDSLKKKEGVFLYEL